MRDDESPYSTKQESLTSKLLSIMCCRDGCSCPSSDSLRDCCADCWSTARRRRDSTKLSKDIEYVVDKQCTSSGSAGGIANPTNGGSTSGTRRSSRKSSSGGGVVSSGVGEDGGYDNEACTAMLERGEPRRPTLESPPGVTLAAVTVSASSPTATTPDNGNGNANGNGHRAKDIKSELYHRIEMRRSNSISTTPVIDWKAFKDIQFWTVSTSKVEGVQPRLHPGRRSMSVDPHGNHLYQQSLIQMHQQQQLHTQPSPLDHGFKPQLYQQDSAAASPDGVSDGLGGGGGAEDDDDPDRFALGQLHFSVQYEIPTRMLLVKVIEARDLARPLCLDESRQDMAHSNPYVRVCLLPDQKNAHQTTVKRKTQSPAFDETFAFELQSYREVQMRTLQLKVKDFDKYSRHCVVGHVLLPLDDVNLVKGRHMWKPLVPCEKEQHDLGDLMISLNYLPSAGRLNVDVIKAKQLLQTDISGGSVPFVRISLVLGNKHWKSKKTSCKKNTIDPVFNESFSFHVSPVELAGVTAVLTAWDHNSGLGRDHFIGRVVLGKLASGPDEITHWERMLRSHRSPIAQWHSLRSRQECDQLSPASLLVP